MKRYAVGANVVLKLVSYDEPPAAPQYPAGAAPRPGSATSPWSSPMCRDAARQAADAGHTVVEEPTAFPRYPGWGGASSPTRTATGSNSSGRSERMRPTLFRTRDATADGRIRVPADLDAVTDVGDEDPGGLSPAAVERIWDAARHWYAAGMQPAIQLCLRHNGRVVLNRAIGHARATGPTIPRTPNRFR